MTFSVGASGVWKTATRSWVGVSGVWKPVVRMWVGAGGAWKQFYAALSVVVNNYNQQFPAGGANPATTLAVSPIIDGGSGSYTYSWTYVSGDIFTINSPTGASTTFSADIANGAFKSGVYRCTVTDTVFGVSAFDDFTVSLSRADF